MNKRSIQTVTVFFVIGLISGTVSMSIASGEMVGQDSAPTVPKYSEKCAHGHSGYDCKEPSWRHDIRDLQERVSTLERFHKR